MKRLTSLSPNHHESAYVCIPRNNNLIIDDLVKSSAGGLGALAGERTEPADTPWHTPRKWERCTQPEENRRIKIWPGQGLTNEIIGIFLLK
jgi:hypothetical protein